MTTPEAGKIQSVREILKDCYVYDKQSGSRFFYTERALAAILSALLAAKPKKKLFIKPDLLGFREQKIGWNDCIDTYEERIKEIMK